MTTQSGEKEKVVFAPEEAMLLLLKLTIQDVPPQERALQLFVQWPSLKNIHSSNIIWTKEVILRNECIHIFKYIYALKKTLTIRFKDGSQILLPESSRRTKHVT